MNKLDEKIKQILNHLYEEWLIGWASYQNAWHIHNWVNTIGIKEAKDFLITTFFACEQSSLLALSNILLDNKDSVNIWYLLNCVNQSLSGFAGEERNLLKRDMQKHQVELKELAILKSDELRLARDKRIAHLDRKFVTSPEKLFPFPLVNMEDAEVAYQRVLYALNVYSSYFHHFPVTRQDIIKFDDRLRSDFRYLKALIAQQRSGHEGQ